MKQYTYLGKPVTVIKEMNFDGDTAVLIQRQCWTGAMIYEWISKGSLKVKEV